jgi:hypothetical protein
LKNTKRKRHATCVFHPIAGVPQLIQNAPNLTVVVCGQWPNVITSTSFQIHCSKAVGMAE